MTVPVADLGEEVAEACADALLTACAQVLVVRKIVAGDDDALPVMDECRVVAVAMLDRVIERTLREGEKPR